MISAAVCLFNSDELRRRILRTTLFAEVIQATNPIPWKVLLPSRDILFRSTLSAANNNIDPGILVLPGTSGEAIAAAFSLNL